MKIGTGIFTNVKGDLLGGITAGIVALPLALAFGVSSGLGPSAGLYGAIFIGFFAALFGGTATQISGPTAPMAAVSMVVIASIIAENNGDLNIALPSILIVFFLVGLLQVGLGLIKVGHYIKYIPYPVISGFMTGIGVIILITQLLPMLGYYATDDMAFVEEFRPKSEEVLLEKILGDEVDEGILVLEDFEETIRRSAEISEQDIWQEAKNLAKSHASGVIGTLRVLPRALGHIQYIELLLCLITILIIYGFKRITTAIPSTLVALIVVTLGALLMGVDYVKIEQIPGGIPIPRLDIFTNFELSRVSPYFFTALTLALLGAIDSLLTSVVADNMTKTQHDSNQELLGQGIGNSVAAIFGGIPGAGATIRTVVNINSGGKTKLSGMVAALLLLVTLLILGPIASLIPAAVLAGILITVGFGVMDYKGLRAVAFMPKADVAIMFVVMVLAVVWNLLYAVGIGFVLATIVFMKKIGDFVGSNSEIRDFDQNEIWPDETGLTLDLKKSVAIKHLEGPIFFGSKFEIKSLVDQIDFDSKRYVVVRMDRVPYIDQSGLYSLEDGIMGLTRANVEVILVGVREQPFLLMESVSIVPTLVPRDRVFSSFEGCLAYLRQRDTV